MLSPSGRSGMRSLAALPLQCAGGPATPKTSTFCSRCHRSCCPRLLDDLVERGFALDQAAVVKGFVQHHMTAFTFGPVQIDWLKPVLPLYSRVLADAQPLEWSRGHTVRVATAEGLILTKMIAFRPQDQIDIETLLIANRDDIDIDLIRQEWAPLAATEADRTAWLDAAIDKRVVRRE